MIDWLISVLEDFKHAGPVAQIGFLLGIGTLCGGAIAALRQWRKSGFERLEKQIEELKRRLESADVRTKRLEAEKREVEERLAAVSARDPWGLLHRAETERGEGNEEPALALFRQAIENNAPTLAEAAVELAQFHLSCFGESEAVEHLAAADRYARIARHLAPDDKRAAAILPEIEALRGRFAAARGDFVAAGHHWDDAFGQGAEGLTGPALIHRLTEAAGSNIDRGHYYTAFALARRAAMLAGRELLADDPLRLAADDVLGASQRLLGAYSEARQQLVAVLAKEERVLGPEHPNTLATAHAVAACLRAMGEDAAARERFEAVLAKEERVLGPEHPDTLVTQREIGRCLDALGSHPEAVEHLTGMVATSEAVLGSDHPTTLRGGHALGLALHHAGRTDEARIRLGQVLAEQERKLGPSHPDTEKTRAALAEMDRDASTAA